MGNKQTQNLDELVTPVDNDELVIYDSTTGGELKKIKKSNLLAINTFAVNVKDYGAVGDGTTDDTEAIQEALDLGRKVLIPAGTYKITSALKLGGYDQVIEGEGMTDSIISLSGAINGFVDSDLTYNRCVMRDFSIIGNTDTLCGLYFATKQCYNSSFDNLKIYTGQQAVHFPRAADCFSYSFNNCHFNSYNNHGIEIGGGSGVMLKNCYAHNVGANSAGFRVWSGALLLNCNGIDSNSKYWGIFGATLADDGVDVYATSHLVDCNIEAYNYRGLWVKNDNNRMKIEGCGFIPRDDYDCSIYIEAGSVGQMILENPTQWSVTGRIKAADIYQAAGSFMGIMIGTQYEQYDKAGVLTNLPRIYSNGTTIVTV